MGTRNTTVFIFQVQKECLGLYLTTQLFKDCTNKKEREKKMKTSLLWATSSETSEKRTLKTAAWFSPIPPGGNKNLFLGLWSPFYTNQPKPSYIIGEFFYDSNTSSIARLRLSDLEKRRRRIWWALNEASQLLGGSHAPSASKTLRLPKISLLTPVAAS